MSLRGGGDEVVLSDRAATVRN